jgi:hypothetical protein
MIIFCSFLLVTSLLQLLDVFSSKTNLNLVLEFLDTDLEMVIKDRALVFLPADIKSWMAMTFRGLEFCHRNFILHRVSDFTWQQMSFGKDSLCVIGSQTKQSLDSIGWAAKDRRFRSSTRLCRSRIQNDLSSHHSVIVSR